MKKICIFMLLTAFVCVCLAGCGKDKLAEGSYVQLGTYSDEPMLWRVYKTEDQNAYLMAEKIISLKSFDATGDYDRGLTRANSGANHWESSALRTWLNAEGAVTYTHEPSRGFVYGGLNSYDKEDGFLTAFSEKEEAFLLPMSRKVYLAEKDKDTAISGTEALVREAKLTDVAVNENAYYTILEEKVSLPCVTELAGMDPEVLVATLTDSAKEDCVGYGDRDTLAYWTITPNGTSEFAQCVINAVGELSDAEPRNSCVGVRPVICMKAAGKGLTGEGTEQSPYIIKK